MGELVTFCRAKSPEHRASVPSEGAQIIIFTGVRYFRAVAPPRSEKRRKRLSIKAKESEARDQMSL
jgi:hypothetical protein